MSTDYLVNDIPWDDEEELVDREPASGEGRTHFGHLRLHALKVQKSWTAGDYVTIPAVKGGDFNEKDGAGLMKFKGWKPGGTRYLFVLVATKTNKDGELYQIVKQYKGKPDSSDEGHDWGDYVYPSLIKSLTDAQRSKLQTDGLYCQWSEVPTGRKFTADDGEEKDIPVWTEFKPFASKEEMEAASGEFFSRFDNGTEASASYPETWGSHVDSMKQYGIALITGGKYNGKSLDKVGVKDAAKALKLTGEDGPVEFAHAAMLSIIDAAQLPPPDAEQLKEEAEFLNQPF